jgi:flagellar basal-body rod protein FlgB
MLHAIFDQTTLPMLQEVLRFSEARHRVLAGNVANADTPGYRVRDLNVEHFQEQLQAALASPPPSPGEATSPGDRASLTWDDRLREVRESVKSIQFLDGSDVGIEQQVTEVAKNQFLHNLTVSIMSSQFRLLQTAISERV